MISSNNVLRSVQTYNPIHLAWFQNQNCFVSDICNHEYNEFLSKNEANLGDTLSIATESSFIAGRGLDAKVQPFVQNIYHISVNQSAGVWAASDVQQQMFNLDKNDYLKNNAGKNMIATLGSFVEQQIAKEAISDSRDYRVGSPTYGQANVNSGPTSFVDFTGGLSSYQQLDQSQQDWIITGAPLTGHKVILPGNYYSPIIGSGLSQFVPKRNEDIAASWMVGKFGTPETTYYKSNALPNHIAGTLGQAQTTCTVVSTNDTTGNNVTQIVLSGAGTDLNALKAGDMGYFITSTSGVPYKTTHVGHMDTDQVAQFRVIADAPSSGGFVTCQLVVGTYTEGQGFCSNPANGLQNINTAIVAGMKVLFVPSHKAGLRVAGDGFYCLIPKLKMKTPWHCAVDTDPETKVSLRMYYGDYLDKDQQLFANDVIFGTLCLPMRSQRILLPLNGNIVTP